MALPGFERTVLPESPDAGASRGHPAVLDRIGQLICGLQGHDEMVEFDGSRMFRGACDAATKRQAGT